MSALGSAGGAEAWASHSSVSSSCNSSQHQAGTTDDQGNPEKKDDQQEEKQLQQEEEEDEGEEIDEYKAHAESLKDRGNEAFQANDIKLAISLYTQAIDIDPDNHVYYSNRSAAYMKADSKSKALHDAEKCVELAPDWAKGYNRLGIAQTSLKRFDAAMDTIKKGIAIDPNNKALWAAKKYCEAEAEKDKDQRFRQAAEERSIEEERSKLRAKIKRDAERERKLREEEEKKEKEELSAFFGALPSSSSSSSSAAAESKVSGDAGAADTGGGEEDELLADFFNEVAAPKSPSSASSVPSSSSMPVDAAVSAGSAPAAGAVVSAGELIGGGGGEDVLGMEEDKERTVHEKYQTQDLGTAREQYERLLAPHYQWRNLNPYSVFQLDIDATEEDIKHRYKKLSLKVHPDRLRGVENAGDAFEQVKEAYAKLCDEKQKKNIVLHIENVRAEVKRERRRLINKGVKESDLPPLNEELSRQEMKHFAEMEHMRRRSETNRRAYSAREKMQEKEEKEKWTRFEEFDKEWSVEERRDKRMGSWRDFQTVPDAKRAKAANFKEETRGEDGKKFGTAEIETWKKSWK